MRVIVVTRLRLRDPALLDEFFTDAAAAIEQAQKADGNLGADALADADNAWWSVTAWQDRRPMQAFVDREPHLGISKRLDHYCDEATFVDWEQDSPDLPSWQTSWHHLTADGKAPELTDPSAANRTRNFPRRSSRLPASPEVADVTCGVPDRRCPRPVPAARQKGVPRQRLAAASRAGRQIAP
jgi:hypothetical protein